MSFGSALALLVGLMVAGPIVAHLLRRGKTTEQPFPPTHLVPTFAVTSQQRSRIEDRLLLAVRMLMILILAVLGATPFVRCSRLSVDRQSGASVALAIVVDDSQSMRAITSDGNSRFDVALAGARQLLSSARDGDTIALIQGGAPSRLLLSPTPDLRAVAQALDSLRVTDRPTDLAGAIALARASLKELPHVDKRVILLSDLAAPKLPDGEPALWTPIAELSKPVDNCGIASAERQDRNVVVTIGCSSAAAAAGQSVQLTAADDGDSEALQSEALRTGEGKQKVTLKQVSLGFELIAKLEKPDAIESDNSAQVAQEQTDLQVAVVADASKASVITGGATVLEQALSALSPDLRAKPLGNVPVAAEDLKPYAAIFLDDPPGLSPESRSALAAWVERGGVAIGFLGPSSTSAELAASLEPFARLGAVWETGSASSIDVASLSWLGEEAVSLADLGQRGRVRLDAAELPGTTIAGRWDDGAPLLFRREHARGLILTVGLPAAINNSDLSLRPGFLALFDEVLSQARLRTGPKRSVAGTPWRFPAEEALSVTGPSGPLAVEALTQDGRMQKQVRADIAGRYEVQSDGNKEWRSVILDPEELTAAPLDAKTTEASTVNSGGSHQVDASPEWALLLLLLFTLELLHRAFGDSLRRRFFTRGTA